MEGAKYRSWVEVNLDNFLANLKEVRRLIGPRPDILQVVKADAYGHGAIEISQVAVNHGAAALGVANTDEGVQLRVGGITAPVIILSPSLIDEIPEILKYNLIPSVSEIAFARELQKQFHKAEKQARIHIEVDTGMGRGGQMNDSSLPMIREIMSYNNVSVEGIFTHLSQSEKTTHHNDRQWQLFNQLIDDLKRHHISIPSMHIANSGAILNFPSYHLDMVRPGLMTYGVFPSDETKTKALLNPVMSFKTRILLIKDFPAGCGIGYGSAFVTRRATTIATIPVGYGDGYSVLLSNTGEALIKGCRVPVVGRISMDMCTLDITDLPNCRVGDEVVLLGRQGEEEITADALALLTGTISYEILCVLGKRAPRVFLLQGRKDLFEPRLRRIFIPDEEKSIARLDNVIRRCLHTRVNDAEFGDAIYYTMLEALFGKDDRQLELRRNFKYDIDVAEFSSAEVLANPSYRDYLKITTHVEYYKILNSDTFFIGCADNSDQLAAFLDDPRCEYRWLLDSGGELAAEREFNIQSVRIDDVNLRLNRTAITSRGYEVWCSAEELVGKINHEVKMHVELVAAKPRKSRLLSVYLIYPIRGVEITFNYQAAHLGNVREIAFFAGKHPYPRLTRENQKIQLQVSDQEWVFPTSGVTFVWD